MTRDLGARMVLPLAGLTPSAGIGSKAVNLKRLVDLGKRVPPFVVIPWHVHEAYRAGDEVVDRLREQLAKVAVGGKRLAVRSSADVEDSFELSYAGQFVSVLDTEGPEEVLSAVQRVWDSAGAAQITAYAEHGGAPPLAGSDGARMAVIVQDMVNPVVSGVVFTRNPVTGIRETVVEAVQGPGTSLMQEGVTPWRWIFHHGEFIEQPKAAVLPPGLVQTVIDDAREVARRVKADLDLEWAWDGRQLSWLQMRRITTVRDVKLYSNRMSRGMIPGLIKPLIWSINIPLVNGAWIQILTELVGPTGLRPEDLAKAFSFRAYFNMGLLGEVLERVGFSAEALEVMWGFVPRGKGRPKFPRGMAAMRMMPRLIALMWSNWRIAGTLDRELPAHEQAFRLVAEELLKPHTPAEVIGLARRLRPDLERVAYLTVVAQMSAIMYNYLFGKELGRDGIDPATVAVGLSQVDKDRFDPAGALRRVRLEYERLAPEQRRAAGDAILAPASNRDPAFGGFVAAMHDLMHRFGHLSDSGTDFSSVPWREDPARLLELALAQPDPAELPSQPLDFGGLRLRKARPWLARLWYRRARRFNLYREHVSYLYALGYGLYRPIFRALAHDFVREGRLPHVDDVFFLTEQEVLSGVASPAGSANWPALVAERRAQMDAARDAVLPEVIYGDEAPPPAAAARGRLLHGTATSRGYCQGPARVVSGVMDFPKVRPGDVLVIPHADVSWTPLFRHAAGVVSESGGMLAHCSIVAREYGIPAVTSVPGAMLLLDGTELQVDGYRGEVSVIDGTGNGHAERSN